MTTLGLALLATSLSYCGGTTRGVPLEFDLAIEASTASGPPGRFTNAEGWDIEVSAAYLLIGPARFYGGGARAQAPSPPWPGLPTAIAHPSDDSFDRGPILGELLVQHAVDLLAGAPTALGPVEGFEGRIETIELQLRPPGHGPLATDAGAAALGEHTFRIEGVATKDGQRVPFFAAGQLPELDDQQIVDSIDADIPLTDQQPGTLVLQVHLSEWLGLVDFSRLTDTDDQGRLVFGPDQQPTAALQRGLRSRFAYSARWSSP